MTSRGQNKPLGELLEIQNGYAFPSESFNEEGRGTPIIRIRDLPNGSTTTFYDGPYDERFLVKTGDYLIGMDGEFCCYIWQGQTALLNQRVCRLQKFQPDVASDFIYYGINEYLAAIEAKTDFVTVKHLSSKQIAAIQMPLPSLSEQKRIVSILDAAEALRRLRERADRRTADLIPALFYEMFGDPATNPKGWPIKSLGAVAREKPNNGIFRKNSEYLKNSSKGLPVVWVGELFQDGTIDTTESRRLDPTTTEVSKYGIHFGDVLFCRSSLKFDGIAYNNVYMGQDNTALFECHLIRVKPNPDVISPIYLNSLMRLPYLRTITKSRSKTATMTTIDQAAICSIPIMLPPLYLQRNFAACMANIWAMDALQANSRRRLENLFQSLLHNAFRGDL